ncbi:MAG: PHP domain-containing protein [Clostridia bacterium]|nr:PHP domain-containing protein [Clostridia bacterium]
MSADLHCHSKISDGSAAVDELVLLAKNNGLSAIAVTDHDTFFGSEKAAVFGKTYGVKIIKGTEISCYDYSRKRKVHLLCYLPKRTDKLSEMIRETNRKRNEAMEAAIQKVIREYPIPYDMILRRATGSTCIYKQHVMQALMDAGYADEMFGEVFGKLFNSRSGIAKTSFEYTDVFDALELVRESGGVAVLAHPAVYNSYDVMLEMIERGLDGIEVHYPRAKESDAKELTELCDRYGLIKTGGTDFHGVNTSKVNPIGTCTTTDEELEKLIKLANSRE